MKTSLLFMKPDLSEVSINNEGCLCEVVCFPEDETIEYKINGITEHLIFGIFFSFHR